MCRLPTRAPRLHLDNISLHIEPGETVAIVGRNGAGKTTLVKLIARLYNPNLGAVLLDGVDVRQLSSDYCTGSCRLCSSSTAVTKPPPHITYYGDWQTLLNNQARIEEIARLADAHEMIENMPEGYETLLGRMFGQHTLSGGQWQKIAIARAFARDAALLILGQADVKPGPAHRVSHLFQLPRAGPGPDDHPDFAPFFHREHGRPHPGVG